MPLFKVKFYIMYKDGILDPQGVAVEKAAHNLGFETVRDVRVGKIVTMQIEASDRTDAEKKLREMAEKFLVNPVIENYSFTLETYGDQS